MSQEDIDATQAPLMEHLIELRKRLVWALLALSVCFVFCFAFSGEIYDLLVIPYEKALLATGATEKPALIYTAPQEAFFTRIKLSLFGAFFVAFPVIASQLWMFVAPGLYANERKAFLPFLLATPVLFIMGASLVYFFIMPLAMQFFLSYEQIGDSARASIEHLPRVSEYLTFVMTLLLAFGLSFQLPVLLTLLGRVGLVTSEGLKRNRKFAIVGVFAVAAFLTPPDIISQIGLGVPVLLLYELSVYSVRAVERKRERERAESGEPA